LCRLRHKSLSNLKDEGAVPDPIEASINRAYDVRQQRHQIPYSLQYGVNLQLFSNSIDPLLQWHVLWLLIHSELFTYAQAKNLVRASEQVSSLAAEISTQLQGICPAQQLDNFRPCCSVTALSFGLAHTPTTKGATVRAFESSTSDSLHIPIVVDTGASLSLTPFLVSICLQQKMSFFEFFPLKRQKFGEMDGLVGEDFNAMERKKRKHGNRNKCKEDNDKNKV
jgi:hypothetical protein